MSEGILFLVCWAGSMAFVGSVVALMMNYDRVLVAIFRLCDAPVYAEARMIAGMIFSGRRRLPGRTWQTGRVPHQIATSIEHHYAHGHMTRHSYF
jgi:hypothetical protein